MSSSDLFFKLLIYMVGLTILLSFILSGTHYSDVGNGGINIMYSSVSDFMHPELSINDLGINIIGDCVYNLSATKGLYMKSTGVLANKNFNNEASGGASFGNVPYNDSLITEKYWLTGMNQNPNDEIDILINSYSHVALGSFGSYITDHYYLTIRGNKITLFDRSGLSTIFNQVQDIGLTVPSNLNEYNITYQYFYLTGDIYFWYDTGGIPTYAGTFNFKSYYFTTQTDLNIYESQVRPSEINLNNYNIGVKSVYQVFNLKQIAADMNNLWNVLFKILLFDVNQQYLPYWFQIPLIKIPELTLIYLFVRLVRGGG